MKTIFKALALATAPVAVLALSVAPAAAQSKVGIAVADLRGAVGGTTAYATAQTQMGTTYKATIDSVNARRTALDTELKTKSDALQAAAKAAGEKPTPAQQTQLQTQYNALQQRGQEAQAELQRIAAPLQLANAYVEEQIGAKLGDALKAAMTKTKTDLILTPDATVSYQPSVDITAAVVTELNALVPSVGIVPPAGWRPGQQGQAAAPAAAAPANPAQKPSSR